MKVWISKYALTDGITEHDCEAPSPSDPDRVYPGPPHFHPLLGFQLGKDAHTSRDNAVRAAESMRIKRIGSLRNQLAALESMHFRTSKAVEPGARWTFLRRVDDVGEPEASLAPHGWLVFPFGMNIDEARASSMLFAKPIDAPVSTAMIVYEAHTDCPAIDNYGLPPSGDKNTIGSYLAGLGFSVPATGVEMTLRDLRDDSAGSLYLSVWVPTSLSTGYPSDPSVRPLNRLERLLADAGVEHADLDEIVHTLYSPDEAEAINNGNGDRSQIASIFNRRPRWETLIAMLEAHLSSRFKIDWKAARLLAYPQGEAPDWA